MKNIYFRVDRIFKILLLIFAQIVIFALTLSAIILVVANKQTIEKQEGINDAVKSLLLDLKTQMQIWIWFLIPISIYLISTNIYKLYNWLYEQKTNKKKKKHNLRT